MFRTGVDVPEKDTVPADTVRLLQFLVPEIVTVYVVADVK
jgi:hypothetical protein